MASNFKKILTPWKFFYHNNQLDITDIDQEDAEIIDMENQDKKPELTKLAKIHNYKTGFKVIILGDVGVGKTSIFGALMKKAPTETTSTYRPESGVISHNDIILLFNDTVGQEAFRSICQNYYREPQIVIFVYDISRMETFMNIPQWQQEVIKRNDPNYPIKYYLVANKKDLDPERDLIGGEKFAEDNDMEFMATSIKDNSSIESLRNRIFEYVSDNKHNGKLNLSDYIKLDKMPSMDTCCNVL